MELSNSAVNTSQSKDSDDNVCRSEYVFSESNNDHSPVNSKVEAINKRCNKDCKNNKKGGYSLDSEYFSTENIPTARREDHVSKSSKCSEGKLRHSYSQDLQSHHSPDELYDDLWPSISENQHRSRIKEDRKAKTALGPNGKPAKLNNNADQIVGENIQNLLLMPGQGKSQFF